MLQQDKWRAAGLYSATACIGSSRFASLQVRCATTSTSLTGDLAEGLPGHASVSGLGFPAEAPSSAADVAGLAANAAEIAGDLPARGWEVATLAAGSILPVGLLEHLIEHVHVAGGLPWWGAIVATTIAIRLLTFPVAAYQMRAAGRLTILKPELQRITDRVKASGYDPVATEQYSRQMKELFRRHGTSPFAPFAGVLIQAPVFISFFFAIQEMAKGLPSFKTGGALWFTDLSTPDELYILPVVTALTFIINIELGAAEGMDASPSGAQQKLILRVVSLIMVPFMMTLPKALLCYFVTANLVSLVQATVLRRPAIRKAIGLPDPKQMAAAAAAATGVSNPSQAAGTSLYLQPKSKRPRSASSPPSDT